LSLYLLLGVTFFSRPISPDKKKYNFSFPLPMLHVPSCLHSPRKKSNKVTERQATHYVDTKAFSKPILHRRSLHPNVSHYDIMTVLWLQVCSSVSLIEGVRLSRCKMKAVVQSDEPLP
jgi:hypothetical protein